MSNKPKIAYIKLGSSVASHVNEIIAGLRRREWTVDLYEPEQEKTYDERGFWSGLYTFLGAQWRLWRNSKKYDAIYVRHHPAILPTVILARLFGIPLVQELNGVYEDFPNMIEAQGVKHSLIMGVIRLGVRLSSGIVVVTKELRSMVVDAGDHEKVVIIHNGANAELFHPDAVMPLEVDGPYAVWFGFLSPWNGIETILNAIEDPAWPESLKMVLIGDGPLNQMLQTAQEKNDKVIFVGKKDQSEIAGIVAHSEMSISPHSDYKGRASRGGMAPLKLFESLACGVPIITSNIPTLRDLVRDNALGLVMPDENSTGLAEAVKSLFEDPDGRRVMGIKAREFITSGNSWDHRAGDTAEFLLSFIKS